MLFEVLKSRLAEVTYINRVSLQLNQLLQLLLAIKPNVFLRLLGPSYYSSEFSMAISEDVDHWQD